MRTSSILSFLTAATFTLATPAEPKLAAENSPGTILVAEFPDSNTSTVRGGLTFTTAHDSVGVDGVLTLKGLPQQGGPFSYHIHEKPVPANGNCTATGKHFDPMQAGGSDSYKCDQKNTQWCELGDLSGKAGAAVATANGETTLQFTDRYIVNNNQEPYYVGNLSVVVHAADKTRLACANFVLKSDTAAPGTTVSTGGDNKNGTTGGNSNKANGTSTSSPKQPENLAPGMSAGAGGFLFAFAAMAFLL